LKKIYFSSHKQPKQQSTSFWSQGILGVKHHLTWPKSLSLESNPERPPPPLCLPRAMAPPAKRTSGYERRNG
jgi:hypothetical protein